MTGNKDEGGMLYEDKGFMQRDFLSGFTGE